MIDISIHVTGISIKVNTPLEGKYSHGHFVSTITNSQHNRVSIESGLESRL